MATYDLTTNIPSATDLKTGDILNCPYNSSYKSVTLPKGTYKLEVWGAQGGSYSSGTGGKGGYSVGLLTLTENTTLNLYSGGTPTSSSAGFNGGSKTASYGYGGGGGSDIRINSTSLYARVIVAGGGGSNGYSSASPGGYGGGITGGNGTSGSYAGGGGGTQTKGGSCYNSSGKGTFGKGGYMSTNGGGAGGGWYGGGHGYSGGTDSAGGGGSGYIYTSSTASNYPSGCLLNSTYYLSDASTKAGNESFTSPTGSTETGHTGSGYCRITCVKISVGTVWLKSNGVWTELTSSPSDSPFPYSGII